MSANLSRRRLLYKLIALSVSFLLALILAEVGLRLVERFRLGDRRLEAHFRNDPVLGFSLQPYAIGHDANGFRNDAVPNQVDVVAIGDSQTWGVNVARTGAWPQQLAKLSGRSVYNMGLGGYGPAQYLVLTERAKKLSPRIIVIGIYLGNDIYDAYYMVYKNENYKDLRRADFSQELMHDTVGPSAAVYWDQEKNFHNNYGRSDPAKWGYWLRAHSALGRLIDRAELWPGSSEVDYEIDREWAKSFPQHGSVYEGSENQTVFTAAYRLEGLNLNEPRISEGLRITEEILKRLQSSANENDTKLVFLLIPTKESVYAAALRDRLPLSPTLVSLVNMEEQCRASLLKTCQTQGLDCVDPLPTLSEGIRKGEKLYPSTTESHPLEKGYFLIASTVNDRLSILNR